MNPHALRIHGWASGVLFWGLVLVLTGCSLSEVNPGEESLYGELLPGMAPPADPPHNATTAARVELGERLFFDKRLSRNNTVSCASCHHVDKAFTDGRARSRGIDGRETLRNAPTLLGIGYPTLLNWDGGAITLEQQALGPIEDENEMDAHLGEILERLATDPSYLADFSRAFGDGPSVSTLARALASYQRTLLPRFAPYDAYRTGHKDTLSPQAQKGLLLFNQHGCASCHSGPRLTSDRFANNGVAVTPEDEGRARITLNPRDRGFFRIPTLREVEHTAPYFHDGRLATLEEVIRHYARGGDQVAGQDPRVVPFTLEDGDVEALVAFLKSLSAYPTSP